MLFCYFEAVLVPLLPFSTRRSQAAATHGGSVHPGWEQTHYRGDARKRTNFNLVRVEFGRHGAAAEVELSSAWLVRVSDEPAVGTTDYCCTFTAKGRKKGRVFVRALFIISASIARFRVLRMTQ